MKCPTCNGAKEGFCCSCEKPISAEEQSLAPDPFASEIYDDDSLHLQCADCSEESAGDI